MESCSWEKGDANTCLLKVPRVDALMIDRQFGYCGSHQMSAAFWRELCTTQPTSSGDTTRIPKKPGNQQSRLQIIIGSVLPSADTKCHEDIRPTSAQEGHSWLDSWSWPSGSGRLAGSFLIVVHRCLSLAMESDCGDP